MKPPLSINQQVWLILQKDLAIQKDLARGLINVRALAKHISDTYNITAGIDAVISAIRRFEGQNQFERDEKELQVIFHHGIVSTKNNMCCITLNLTFKKVAQRLGQSGHIPDCKVVTGDHAVKLIVDNPDSSYVKGLFSDDETQKIDKDLSEIAVVVSPQAVKTKGVMARIANEIALANINIIELLVCPPEFRIYVKEKDIVRAHESVLKLCNKE